MGRPTARSRAPETRSTSSRNTRRRRWRGRRGRPRGHGVTWVPDAAAGETVPRHGTKGVGKGLDGARIFTAMSSGPRARAEPGAPPVNLRPPPTRCPLGGEVTRAFRRPSRGGLERVYQDRSLTCRDCTEEFGFSAGEQAFFASKGLTNDPQRCPSCRAVASERDPRMDPRVPCRDLRGLRGPGRRAVRATERPSGLLQCLLRQGSGRHHVRSVTV